MNRKIIFLDIDGVLNDHRKIWNHYCGIHAPMVKRLNHVIAQIEAHVVISSAWRYMVIAEKPAMNLRGFTYMMQSHGFAGVIIDTTVSDEVVATREGQILRWVSENGPPAYVVVDDLPLDLEHFVQTDGNVGLTDDDAEKMIAVLNRTPAI